MMSSRSDARYWVMGFRDVLGFSSLLVRAIFLAYKSILSIYLGHMPMAFAAASLALGSLALALNCEHFLER